MPSTTPRKISLVERNSITLVFYLQNQRHLSATSLQVCVLLAPLCDSCRLDLLKNERYRYFSHGPDSALLLSALDMLRMAQMHRNAQMPQAEKVYRRNAHPNFPKPLYRYRYRYRSGKRAETEQAGTAAGQDEKSDDSWKIRVCNQSHEKIPKIHCQYAPPIPVSMPSKLDSPRSYMASAPESELETPGLAQQEALSLSTPPRSSPLPPPPVITVGSRPPQSMVLPGMAPNVWWIRLRAPVSPAQTTPP